MPTCGWSQAGAQFCPPSRVFHTPPQLDPEYTTFQSVGSMATDQQLPLKAVGPYSSHLGGGWTTSQPNGTPVDGALVFLPVVTVNHPLPWLFTLTPGNATSVAPGMLVASTVRNTAAGMLTAVLLQPMF